MKKIAKPILLPTDKASDLWLHFTGKLQHNPNEESPIHLIGKETYQHLYITSDEEINGRGFRMDLDRMSIGVIDDNKYYNENGNFKKIISSTDEALGLPKPSQEFITRYVEEYNKGNVIDKVLVDYDLIGECNGNNGDGCFQDSPAHNCGCYSLNLKLTDDNCIVISREEPKTLPEFLYEDDGEIKTGRYEDSIVTDEWNKWIKENLK